MSRRNRFGALPSPSSLLWLLLLAAPPAAATSDGPAVLLTGVDPTVAQLGPECPILCPGRPSFYGALPSRLSAFGDRLLFAASDPAHGVEPWSSDGTFQGTGMLADVCPGDCSSLPLPFGVAAGEDGPLALFWATTPDAGREPWVTDGTVAGTRMLADLCPGACNSGEEWDWWGFDGLPPAVLRGVEMGGEVYFGAHGPAEGGLYVSDGTRRGPDASAALPRRPASTSRCC
jgi:ELWxxDGT repeat protein